MVAPSVEIPQQPTLRWTCGPPERLSLPITAASRLGFFGGLFVLAFLPIGLMTVVAGLILALAVWDAALHFHSFGDFVVTIAGLVCANFGLVGLGSIFTMLSDRRRSQPVLTIESGGVRDRRLSDETTPWSAVSQASIVYGDPYTRQDPVAVRLTLNTTMNARHNPFRPGALAFNWKPRPNELYVPLYFLNRPRRVLAHAIATLAGDAGATVAPEVGRGQGRQFAFTIFVGALAQYALPYLLVIGVVVVPMVAVVLKLLAPIARRRGWFAHGRLNAHMNRPKFDDETHRASSH